MDFARLAKLWNDEPVGKLIAAIEEAGPRLGPGNVQVVELRATPRRVTTNCRRSLRIGSHRTHINR